jgi:hypothetical protein
VTDNSQEHAKRRDRTLSRRFVLDRYIRRGHRQVDGWIEPPILRLIAALAKEQERQSIEGGTAEIGVHHGRLFLALHLARRPQERSVAIDLFADQAGNIDQSGSGNEAAFRQNLLDHAGGSDDVTIVSADSTTLSGDDVREFVGGPVRLFSVDGGHAAEIVEHDMQTSADSLTDGGIVIGDDVFNFLWPGAAEGTLHFLDKTDELVPFAIGYNKVLFTTPNHAEKYREVVKAVTRRRLGEYKDSVMHGSPVIVVWKPRLKRKPRLLAKRALRHW